MFEENAITKPGEGCPGHESFRAWIRGFFRGSPIRHEGLVLKPSKFKTIPYYSDHPLILYGCS